MLALLIAAAAQEDNAIADAIVTIASMALVAFVIWIFLKDI